MATDTTIVVTGATGTTGRRVAARLRGRGANVRAVSRSTRPRFDWTDPKTWDDVLPRASAVYLVVADPAAAVDEFVTRAVAAGVNRFVVLSARGVREHGHSPMLAAEQAVRHSGADWTILRPSWFFQNFSEGLFHPMLMAGELALPAGQAREAFVDAEDIADVAVAALTDRGHSGRVYELSGPHALTFGEAVRIVGAASGRPIRYTDLSREEFVAGYRAAGASAAEAEYAAVLFDFLRGGGGERPGDGVLRALGRAPGDFTAHVARAAAAGAWS